MRVLFFSTSFPFHFPSSCFISLHFPLIALHSPSFPFISFQFPFISLHFPVTSPPSFPFILSICLHSLSFPVHVPLMSFQLTPNFPLFPSFPLWFPLIFSAFGFLSFWLLGCCMYACMYAIYAIYVYMPPLLFRLFLHIFYCTPI